MAEREANVALRSSAKQERTQKCPTTALKCEGVRDEHRMLSELVLAASDKLVALGARHPEPRPPSCLQLERRRRFIGDQSPRSPRGGGAQGVWCRRRGSGRAR